MNYFKGLVSNVRGFYSEINSATLTGAIDVIVIRQEDGSFLGSPFHVRFGKLGVLRSREKIVDIMINGEPVDLQMKLGEAGEAFFVEEVEEPSGLSRDLITTPIPLSTNLIDKIEEQKDKENDQDSKSETANDTKEELDSATENKSLETEELEPNEQGKGERKENTSEQDHTQGTTETLDNKDVTVDELKESKTDDLKENEKLDKTQNDKILTETKEAKIENEKIEAEKDKEMDSSTDVGKVSNSTKEEFNNEQPTQQNINIPGRKRTTDSENTADELDTNIISQEDELSKSYSQGIPIPGRQVENYSESDSNWTDSASLPKEEGFRRDHSYPLSDLDSPIGSPRTQHMQQHLQPFNPQHCLSDTEAEIQQSQDNINVNNEVTWDWGKLPKGPENGYGPERKLSEHKKEESGHGFRNKRKDYHKSTKIREEGIYLDDLNSIDQELAALYLNQALTSKDDRRKGPLDSQITEDRESGIGQSLPSSPTTELVGSKYPDSESTYSNFAMSLCGDLKSGKVPLESFISSQITYDDLSSNPTLLNDPKLVIRINDRYYNWQIAAPMLMSYIMFHRPLKQETVQSLVKQHMPKKEKRRSYYWFSWRQNYDEQSSDEEFDLLKDKPRPRAHNSPRKPHTTTPVVTKANSNEDLTQDPDQQDENLPLNKQESLNEWQRQRNISECSGNESDIAYKKTTRLTSENLAKLNLHDGANSIRFSVTTKYQGTAECQATIYLWNYDDRIIISDIDGTITKSDVLGQILPVVGQAWAQSGVAHFFSSIERNGYKLLYLSARAIGQAQLTRDYLKSVKQDQITLPDGPLLLSPASLIKAFHREVIEKKPEEFKIAALRDIQSLFPSKKPFYGGFGNKINDVYSYRAVGVSKSRIFTINHKGEVRNELITTFQSSYLRLSDLVDQMFPPYKKEQCMKPSALVASDEFSSFTYWRNPLPEIDMSEIESLIDRTETAPTA